MDCSGWIFFIRRVSNSNKSCCNIVDKTCMTLDELRAAKRDTILAIAAKHGVTSIRVFGSFARGEARQDSDLDLLIEAGPRRTPFFPGGLLADLESALGRPVDVFIGSCETAS
jgi:predicted nucleotidyltransferase